MKYVVNDLIEIRKGKNTVVFVFRKNDDLHEIVLPTLSTKILKPEDRMKATTK